MPQDATNRTLEYVPAHRGSDSSVVAWTVFVLPVLVASLLAVVGAQDFALVGAAATALFMWLRRRRRKKRPQAVLHVDNGRLRVSAIDRNDLLDVPLDELHNVTLDTKTIQRVQENLSSGIPDLRYIDSTVRPEVDVSRLELQTASTSVFLSEEHFSNTDAVEWLGTIRRFLRANGWVPEDERRERVSVAEPSRLSQRRKNEPLD